MDALTVLRREIVSGVVLVAVLVVVRAMQRARLMVAGKVALGSREGGKEKGGEVRGGKGSRLG